jgi:hypothetical protein
MLPHYTTNFGNPHSRTHLFGWEGEAAIEKAREEVAALIGENQWDHETLSQEGFESTNSGLTTILNAGADPKEIIFTSGATESNNMAIKGIANFYKGRKKHIVTTQTEHKCVLDSARHLQTQGWDVTYLPVQQNGLVDLKELEASIREVLLSSFISRYNLKNSVEYLRVNSREGHGGCVCDVRQQRDWGHSTDEGDRGDVQKEGGLLPHRRGTGGGKDPLERGRDEDRLHVHQWPQGDSLFKLK